MEQGAWNRPSPRLRHVRHVGALLLTAAGTIAAVVLLALNRSAGVAVAGALARAARRA